MLRVQVKEGVWIMGVLQEGIDPVADFCEQLMIFNLLCAS